MQYIYNRTFGLELEFGNVVKEKVNLPNGYSWSVDERSIVNTNGKKSTPTGKYGGELNTRPLLLTYSDISELRRVIKDCIKNNGVPMWNTGFDGHLYIGDLGLEELKKIFTLGYMVSHLINKVFNLGEWFNVEHLVPTPTYTFYKQVEKAQSIEVLKNTFANSSNIGHYRFQINIMPYFKTKTLEFRIFNGTYNFRETLETIKFMYSFLDYALNNNIDDYAKIRTEEDFVKIFSIKRKYIPKAINPLIFAESHKEATRNIAKAFAPTKKLLSALLNSTSDNVATVNPYLYTVELALYKDKQITIYNNIEYNEIIYKLATGKLKIEYKEHFKILNKFKKTEVEEIVLFFIFSRVQKYNIETDYGNNEFKAYISQITASLKKLECTALELIELFKKATYKQGTLQDATKDENTIIYQQEYNSKANSAVTALKKYTNYETIFLQKETDYQELSVSSNQKLFTISKNEFLPYVKIAKDLDIILYSTEKDYLGVRQQTPKPNIVTIEIPPVDYEITEKTKIQIREIRPTYFSDIQAKFVKKVSKFKQPRLCYVVTADKYLIGAFGFDYSKDDKYSLFLLSDFCTNNDIRLLSKLILFIIKTKEVKKIIERKITEKMKNGYTKVYTTMPVSMKYRGAFKKVKTQDRKSLQYEFNFGDINSIKDAVREYIKRRKSK